MSISCTKGQLYTTTSTARQIPDLPDKALIRSIVAGDKSAMRILFARHNVRVYRFLLRFVSDKSTADDLVSELFLDVWRQAAKFQARSQVSTWLLAIARNKALAVLRRRLRSPRGHLRKDRPPTGQSHCLQAMASTAASGRCLIRQKAWQSLAGNVRQSPTDKTAGV
jgi:RNA polymerase sigma factor (sigma-70 family)